MAPATMVELFYLGGLHSQEQPHPPVIATDKVYRLPDVGKSMRVKEADAAILQAKNTFIVDGATYQAFTQDKRLAERLTKAGKVGNRVGISSVDQLSNEELLKLAESRGLKLVDEDAPSGDKADKPKKLTKEQKEKAAAEVEALKSLSFIGGDEEQG